MPTMLRALSVIPAFLLKQLYVKKSLKPTPNGFELTLKNTLANGTITGLAMHVDSRALAPDSIRIGAIRASEISSDHPRAFALNQNVILQVESAPLAPGAHKIAVEVETKEAGTLRIEMEDGVQ